MEHRELKFRAWDGRRMKIDGFIIWDGKPHEFSEYSRDDVYKRDWHLMQYTGLRDKNGREIYEGDILVTSGLTNPLSGETENTLSEVMYKGPFLVYWPIGGTEASSLEELIGWRTDIDDDAEVVGNRYENPELLSSGI